MSAMTETVSSILHRPLMEGGDDDCLSWHPEQAGHDRLTLRKAVESVRQAVEADPRARWLVVDENAARFLAGLLGVLAAGGVAILPQHIGQGAVRQHLGSGQGLVSGDPALAEDWDVPIHMTRDQLGAESAQPIPISRDARLEMFTSGSTGEPKRIVKTVAQLEDELLTIEALWGGDMKSAAVISTVPHYHLYGLLFRLLWPWIAGRRFPEQALLEPPRIAQAVGRFSRSVLVSSPAHLKRWPGYTSLAQSPSELVAVFSSAGPLPEQTALALHHGLDPIAVWEVYGSTETGGIAYRDQGNSSHRHWRRFEGVDLGFPDGEPGPLNVRSPATDHQWLETGDQAEALDSETRSFRLLGRRDGVIKVEDRRISLTEIEVALESSSWVAEAAVLCLDGERQTTAAALVLTEEGCSALSSMGRWGFRRALRSLLASRFTEVALPRRFRYLDSLPRNPMGKLRRRDLLALFEESGA